MTVILNGPILLISGNTRKKENSRRRGKRGKGGREGGKKGKK